MDITTFSYEFEDITELWQTDGWTGRWDNPCSEICDDIETVQQM